MDGRVTGYKATVVHVPSVSVKLWHHSVRTERRSSGDLIDLRNELDLRGTKPPM